MTIYTSTTLAELLDELEMGSPHMGAAIRERVAELQDELEVARDDAAPGWDACPNCEESEAAAEGLTTRADELAAKVGELDAELKGAQAAAIGLEQFREAVASLKTMRDDFGMVHVLDLGAAVDRVLTLIDGQARSGDDTQRLEWLMCNISGAELRRLNVWTDASCDRAAIYKALQPTKEE